MEERCEVKRAKIEAYEFGRIVVDGEVYSADLILLPDRVMEGWWRQEGHVLHPGDLEEVFDAAPEVLIVGQGAYGRMLVPGETTQAVARAGIELIALPTDEAVKRYNGFPAGQRVAAALHLTC
jgi:hypothetical protein